MFFVSTMHWPHHLICFVYPLIPCHLTKGFRYLLCARPVLGLEAAEVNKRPYFYSQGKSRSLQSGMWKSIFLLLFFKSPSKAYVPWESSPRFSCHTRLLHSLKDKQCGLFCWKYQLLLVIVLCCSTIWFYVCVCVTWTVHSLFPPGI